MHRAFVVATCWLVAGAAGVAEADNWLQTGHDGRHTFASKDAVKLPLTDIWNAEGGGPAAIGFGRVYYVTSSEGTGVSTLVCASARTGTVLWRQALWCNTEAAFLGYDDFSPTLSENGIVFIIDARAGAAGRVPGIRAFHALTGQPLGGYVPAPRTQDIPVPLLVQDQMQALPPAEPRPPLQFPGEARIMAPSLLLDGGRIFTSLARWHCCTWTPAGQPLYGVLTHLEQTLNLEKRTIETKRHVGWLDSTFVSADGAAIVSGYWDMRDGSPAGSRNLDFVARVEGPYVRWHRDFPWLVMSPGTQNDTLFSIMSGTPGSQAIAALSSRDGSARWVYPRWPNPITASAAVRGQDTRGFHTADSMVLADGKVFAFTTTLGLVALDQADGHPVWGVKPGATPLAASRDHVFVRVGAGLPGGRLADQLVALRLADGKPEWVQKVPVRTLTIGVRRAAVSDGELYAQGSRGLTAFAPAERTFRLGVDVDQQERYVSAEPAAAKGDAPAVATTTHAAADESLADATVVRLPWSEPLSEDTRRLAARAKAAPRLPLLLQLDWLNPQRDRIQGAAAGEPGALPPREEFVSRCRALAVACQPVHFDLAPELNVFLARHPEQVDAVRELLLAAVREVHAASPGTKTSLSINCEVLSGLYGRGTFLPYGKLSPDRSPAPAAIKALSAVVDEVGLTSCPQAAFVRPAEMPCDYLLAVKLALDAKQVIVANLNVTAPAAGAAGLAARGAFLKRLAQNCYWLNAGLVACPDLVTEDAGDAPRRVAPEKPLAEQVWQDVLRWERVEHLTLALPEQRAAPGVDQVAPVAP